MSDPTKIAIDLDPTSRRMRGVAVHGNTPFDVPYISEIIPGLWQGGCQHGLILPEEITNVVSLYPWEKYRIYHDMDSEVYVRAYDSAGGLDLNQARELATWVNNRHATGQVLVHCQAGLNRSSFVMALALQQRGMSMDEAIALLREKRSPAVLCNQSFEDTLRKTEA